PVHFTIAAVEQIAQQVWRQFVHRMLLRLRIARVGRAAVFDERRTGQPQRPCRRQPSRATVAVAVDVALYPYFRTYADLVRFAQVWNAGRMHMQHADHGHGRWNLELNVIAQTDQHGRTFPGLSRQDGASCPGAMGDHYYPYRGSIGFKIPIGVSTGSAGKTTWGQPPPAVRSSAAGPPQVVGEIAEPCSVGQPRAAVPTWSAATPAPALPLYFHTSGKLIGKERLFHDRMAKDRRSRAPYGHSC